MKTYDEITKDYDEKVALAMSEDTLPEVLSDLATAMFTYPDTRLVRALFDNPSTPINDKAQIALYFSDEIGCGAFVSIAQNYILSEDVQNKIVVAGSTKVEAAVARNPHTSPNVLEKLIKRSSEEIRMNIVKNPNTPAKLFVELIVDRNKTIADEARLRLKNDSDLFEDVIRSQPQPYSYIPDSIYDWYIETARSYGNDTGRKLEAMLSLMHNEINFDSLPEDLKEDVSFLKKAAFLNYTILDESKIARNNKEVVLEAAKSYKKAKRLGSFGVQKELYLEMLDDPDFSYDDVIGATDEYSMYIWMDHIFLKKVMGYDISKTSSEYILTIRSKIDNAIRFRHYEDYSDEDVKKLVESWYMVNDRLKSINDREESGDKNSDDVLM